MIISRDSRVTPLNHGQPTAGRSAGSIKERVCRIGLTSLFTAAGIYFIGYGSYAYTAAKNTNERTEGSSLIAAGVFCFTSACLVWICMPVKRLVDVVSTVDKIMDKAKEANLQLEERQKEEEMELGAVKTELSQELQLNTELKEKEAKLEKDLEDIKKAKDELIQKLQTNVVQLQQCIQTLLTSMQGLDNQQLNNAVADIKKQLVQTGLITEKTEGRMEQDNKQLEQSLANLGNILSDIPKSVEEKIKSFEKKQTEADQLIVRRTEELEKKIATEKALLTQIDQEQKKLAAMQAKLQEIVDKVPSAQAREVLQGHYTIEFVPVQVKVQIN